MALIDLSNFGDLLVQSTLSRSGAVDGNIFFDVANGRIELVTVGELATLNLHAGATTGSVTIDADVSGTLTLSTGTWRETHGIWKIGAAITIAGYTDTDINGANTIAAISADGTVLTVGDNTAWSTEAGGGDESVASATEANPLIEDDGIKMEALYGFERQERRVDETLRQYDFYFKGTFKFGGAYELVNGRKFDDADGSATSDTTDDRFKVRGSGWIERNTAGAIGRIWYGVKSLGNIEALSQPYYQLGDGDAPVNFDKDGPIDEAIQVYGDNAVDANAYTTTTATAASQTITVVAAARTFTRSAGSYLTDGFLVGERFTAAGLASNTGTYTVESVTALVITVTDDPNNQTTDDTGDADEVLTVNGIDTRIFLSNKVRTYGQNYDEKQLGDSGVTQMDGYASGFALGESVHLTSGNYTLADVYTAQVSPFTGLSLKSFASGQDKSGENFTDGTGTTEFTWILENTLAADLDECVAFLDALAQTDDDIDEGTGTVNGKRVGVWYSYNAAGKVLPVVGTGAAGEGLFIDGLLGTDKNRVIFTDDSSTVREYPAYQNITVFVGADAVADANAWFHAFFETGIGAQAGNDFGTATAITIQEPDTTLVKGDVDGTGLSVGNNILFEFDYIGDTIGGTANSAKDCVFECEGDGGVTAAKTIFALTTAAEISATCQPAVETNV